MKSIKAVIITGLILFFYFNFHVYGANNIPDEINDAFIQGDAKMLAIYFNENIEMTVLETEGIYSKSQAQQIIADFFKKYPPGNFQVIHRGGKEGSNFAICEYKSKEKKFRLTIYLKISNNKSLIHQLRIQYDNN